MVLFFIGLATRSVEVAGIARAPNDLWMGHTDRIRGGAIQSDSARVTLCFLIFGSCAVRDARNAASLAHETRGY